MGLDTGELDQRVTFLVPPVPSDDPMDNGEGAWIDGPTVWAKVVDQRPSRTVQLEDGAPRGKRPSVITIRNRGDITPDMRVRHRGRILEIISGPAEVQDRTGLEMVAVDFSTRNGAA